MPKQQHSPNFRPHDRYFEQVFKNLPLVKQLLRNFLPSAQLFHSVTNFNDQEMANLAESLPPVQGKKFVSTYDNIFGKGRQEGLQEGLHIGIEKSLLAFLKKFPEWTDEQVAATFEVDMDTVKRVREQI